MTETSLHRRSFLRTLAAGGAGAALLRPLEAAAEVLDRAGGEIAFRADDPRSHQRLRDRYLLDPEITYLNHASIGTVPRPVHEARVEYLRLCETNPWLHMWGGAWEEPREEARAAVAGYLGAEADDLALTHNTTEGFSLLASGLPIGPGDEVLFTELNHDGASVAFERWGARRGYAVRRAPFPVREAADLDADAVIEAHLAAIRPETRLLVLPHLDNMVGIRIPLARLAREARAAGVEWIAVDAAQTAGMFPVNLSSAGIDVFAGSPHKWLQAPKGLGMLWLSPRIREVLEPMWMTWGQARWAGTVRVFEDYGTRNLAEAITLADAVAFQRSLDEGGKEARLRAIHTRIRDRVDAAPGLRWASPRRWEDGGALIAVEPLGRSAPELGARLLRDHGVVLRSFGGDLNVLRLSPHVITTDAEVERVCDLIEAAP